MHAVIIEVDLSGADPDTAIKRLREEIVPRLQQSPGFRAGTWLRPNSERKGFSLVVFEREADARDAMQAISVGSEVQPGVIVERSELREVAVSV